MEGDYCLIHFSGRTSGNLAVNLVVRKRFAEESIDCWLDEKMRDKLNNKWMVEVLKNAFTEVRHRSYSISFGLYQR